jgi:hypothetical protein
MSCLAGCLPHKAGCRRRVVVARDSKDLEGLTTGASTRAWYVHGRHVRRPALAASGIFRGPTSHQIPPHSRPAPALGCLCSACSFVRSPISNLTRQGCRLAASTVCLGAPTARCSDTRSATLEICCPTLQRRPSWGQKVPDTCPTAWPMRCVVQAHRPHSGPAQHRPGIPFRIPAARTEYPDAMARRP